MNAPWLYFDACVRAARRIVRDEDTARDIAVIVMAAEPTNRGTAINLAKWRAIDHLRKGRLDIVRGYDVERAAGGATPEEILTAKQERESLIALLGADAVRILENPEGLDDAALAALLLKSPEAIRQIRSRARRRLLEEV